MLYYTPNTVLDPATATVNKNSGSYIVVLGKQNKQVDNIVATKCYEEGKVGSCGREGKCGDVTWL